MGDQDPTVKDGLPSPDEVLAGIANGSKPSEISRSEDEYRWRFKKNSIESQTEYAHLTGIHDHYKHKGRWSWFLMICIFLMLLFQSGLLLFVGTGKLDFTEYDWLLPALLVQNLGQVIGLAVYAVKFLFSDINRSPTE